MAKKKSFLDELKEIESGSSYVSTSTRASSSHKKSFLDELKDIEINGYTPNDLNTTIKSNETTEQPKQKKWLTADEILSGANFTNTTSDNNISTNNANRDFEISANDTRQKKQSMESYINNYIENNKNSLKYQNYIGSTEDKEKQLRYDAMRTKDYMDLEKQYLESKNKTDKLDKQAHGSFFKQAEGSKITGIEAIDNVLNTGINVGVSALDAGENALKGIFNFSEGIVDTGRYALSGATEKLGEWTNNEGLKEYSKGVKERAKQNTTDLIFGTINKTTDPTNILDSRSYLAPRGEGVAQSVGYSAGFVATGGISNAAGATGKTAQFIQDSTTFASAYGNARSEAYEMGMNDKDSNTYALINGATEAFTERMFGQFAGDLIPGQVKGLNKGTFDFDDKVANMITSKMKNSFVKNLVKYEVKNGFEGLEEVVGGLLRPTAYKMFMNDYFKDANWGELVKDEHLLESFIDGAVSSMISSAPGLYRNTKNKTDYITGNTYKEDAIIDSEVKFRQEEAAKKKGSELTKEEKKTIKAEVEEDLETGDLNVDRIERQLNPEGVAKIEELQKKYDNAIEQTEKEELGKQLNEAKLDHYKFMEEELKSNNKLNATYREEALRKEEFKPALKEGDKDFTEETKRLYEEVKKANANNSTRTHNVVNSANKFQNENGTAYHFVNTEQIKKINEQRKELGLKPYIENANGFVGDNGEVYINLDSRNALNSIIGHETTHLLESSGKINKLRDLVQEFAETKGIWSERLKKVEEIYKKNKVDADARAELVNDIIGEYMFTDEDFVRHLSKKDMNIFQSFFNNIKNAINYVTAGSKEERQLEKAKQLYEKIYRETKEVAKNKNAQYMIKETNDGIKYVVDNKIKQDGNISEKDIFNSLKNKEYTFEDGDKAYIIGWLNSKDENKKDKSIYRELFIRYPSIFKNIEDINDFNSLVNYNTDELLETSQKIKDKIKDINQKHKAWNIESFDTRESILYDETNDKAYIIDFSIANLKNGKKIAYAKKMAQADDTILEKIKSNNRSENSPAVAHVDNISQKENNVKSLSLAEQLEKQGTKIMQEAEEKRIAMIDNFKEYLEEHDITNPTQKDIDDSITDLLSYDNEQSAADNARDEKLYNKYVREYMKENNIKFNEKDNVEYSLSDDGALQDQEGNKVTLDLKPEGNLLAAHSINEDNLKSIISLGGIPAASIGITNAKDVDVLDEFGGKNGYVLLFDKDSINPKNKLNEVYNRDIYSNTFPEILQKVDKKKYNEIIKEFRPYESEYGSFNRDYSYNSSLDKIVNDLSYSSAAKAKFLDDNGYNYEKAYRKYKSSYGFTEDVINKFIKENPELSSFNPNMVDTIDEINEIAPRIKEIAIDMMAESNPTFTKKQFEELFKDEWRLRDITDFYHDINNYKRLNGQQEFDMYETRDNIDKVVKEHEEEYKQWLIDKFTPVYGDKYFENKNGTRKYDYTLDNLTAYMKKGNTKAQQTGLFDTFGIGQAKGASATEYKSIDEIREASKNLVDKTTYKERHDSFEQLDEPVRTEIGEARILNGEDVFEVYSDYYIALSKAASGVEPSKALSSNYFNNITPEQLDKFTEVAKALKNLPAKYFEAKPQRTIQLDEIKTILAPIDGSESFKEQLRNNGFNVVEYNPDIEGDKTRVAQEQSDLLFSLSKEIAPIRNGIYSKDILLPTKEENDIDLPRRATEQDLDAMEKQFNERLPEYIPYEEPETISTYEKTKADIRRIGQDIKKELGLRTRDMHNVYEAVDTFLNKENLSANDLYNYFDKIYDNTITLPNDTYNDFVEDLKNTPFSVSDKVKNDVLDYKNRRSEHMGQLVINDYSRNIDVAYEELREKYPMLPVEYNESAMLENIFDMLDSNDTIQVQDLSENDLKEVLMDSADKVYADIKQMKYEKQMKQEQSTRKLAEQEVYNASKTMKKVKIAYEGQDSYKKTRSMIQEELLNEGNITIDDIDVGKDIVALNYQITDPVRVNEKVFGAEVGQKINEFTTYHVRHNEAESIRWQNAEREEIKALDIKSKREKALVQKYGEKQYVNEFGDLVEFGDKELAKEVKSDKEFEKIKHAAEVIRSKYDNYIDMANNVLTEMGYDPIPKRKDYMRHFEELSDKFSQWGVPLNLETLNKENLPTDINGLTDMNRPGKAYFASANRRTGVKTTYDAIKGIDGYISGIADVIYHTEDIQRYRALSKFIRETYGQTKGFEHLDGLTEQEQIKRIDDIQSNKLSGYAAWLDNQANLLANKKTKIDRGFEEVFGRRVYGVLETAKKQVGSNMTGLNFRSALTNFASTIQAFGKTNKIATIKGYASTIRNLFVNDNLIQQSDFLTDRFGTDMLNKKMWQKVSNYGQIFMTGTDYLTSNMIWRSKYFESLGKGYNNTESIKIADDFAARIMGDRSKGQTAAIFSSKTLGLFTQFQLEVNNQWQAMIHDNKMAIERKQMTTAGLIWQFGQLTALSAIFNEIMTNLTGSDVMLDPYEIFKELFAPDDDDEDLETRLQRVEKNILDNLPMGNLITGGGRIPINEAFKGLTSVIKKSVGGKNEYGNEITWEDVKSDTLDSLGYWLLPTGYGQVKKTKKGLDMYNHDTPGAYTKSGNLKYEVNDDMLTKIQAMLFGASANPGAREYYNKGYRALKPDEVKEAKDYGMSINKYREFMDGLESVSKTRVENENGTLTRYTDGTNTYWYNKDTKQVYDANMKKVSKDITKLEKVSASDEKYKYIKNLDLPTSTKTKIINNELGKNSTITDNYGYVKYKDSDNKVYWYDEDTGKLYDSKYRQSTKNVRSLTKVSNTMTSNDINKYNSLDDYNSVSSNPTKQKLIEQVGTNKEYQSYRDEIENIKDQYASNDNMTSKQKTKQSQVRKRKVQEYINTLPLNVPQKLILQKLSGYSVKDYKSELRPYINSLNISKEEKEKLDKELFD